MSKVIVTTSWDDGHILDIRLAELLAKYDLPATFYVAPKDQEFATDELLKDKDIKKLSKKFEIGAHTITHPRLTDISDREAKREMLDSKKYLEELIGKPVTSFCYPGGNYEAKHAQMAAEMGFTYARTVKRHSFTLKGSLFEAKTTVNAYNHFQDLYKIAHSAHFNPIKTIQYFQWDNLAIAMFDQVMKNGGVYHLWGHSWEIDSHKDWQKLERVFKYIAGHKRVTYVANDKLPRYQIRKLLVASPYFPPHLGGVEFYAYHLSQLLKHDHDWEVVAVTTGKKGFQAVRSSYKGVRTYYVPYWFKISNTPFNPMWYFWFRKIIRKEGVTIINAHAPVPMFADIMESAGKHIPVVISYHMMSMVKGKTGPDKLIRLYEQYILPRTLKGANYIICSSDKVRDIFLKQYRYKSQTITPGVDPKIFTPAKKVTNNTILFVGSLNKNDKHKGVAYLLEAMKTVIKIHPDARLLIVGQGSGQRIYEAMAKEYGLSKHVKFLGGKFDKDLVNIYRKASIFVLPTLNDSYPLVILEAMASGLPVISSKVGGIPQIIDDQETGYLLDPGESKSLAKKIIYLLDNPEVAQQFGKAGRKKVLQGLSWENQASKTDAVLTRALHGDWEKNL